MRVLLAAVALCAAFPLLAQALGPVTVVQKNREFTVPELAVSPGGVVRFENADAFPHQINVSGPGMSYDSDLQDAGERLDVPFPVRGTFQVRCSVHPRMKMAVHVGVAP